MASSFSIFRSKKRKSWLGIYSILLVLTASMGMTSAFMAYSGRGKDFTSPTITYSGYLGISYNGTYHYVSAEPLCNKAFPPCFQKGEVVFYLDTDHETIRLVLYCGKVADFCRRAEEVPLRDESCIFVKGTLLIPSKWPTSQFEPSLQFDGDLYVFQYSTISESSCSWD